MIALQLLTQSSSSSRSSSSSGSGSRNRNTSGSNSNNTMLVHLRLMMVMLTVVLIASHMSVDGLSTASERGSRKLFGGYRITPKFCRASKTLPLADPRAHGPTICMFNHECTQRQGEVVGACMDGFLFGACCQIKGSVDSPLIVEHELVQQSAAAQSYETYGHNNKKPNPSVVADAIPSLSSQSEQRPVAASASAAPVRRPAPSNQNNYIGQFVYTASSSGLDEDSVNTIDGQLTNTYETVRPASNLFAIDRDSVSVSSPSPQYASRPSPATEAPLYGQHTPSGPSALSSSAYGSGHVEEVAYDDVAVLTAGISSHSEYPTRIPTGPFADASLPSITSGTDAEAGYTPDHFGLMADDILNSQSSEFTHSDITHPGVDAVIVGEYGHEDALSGYGGDVLQLASDMLGSTSTTEATTIVPTTILLTTSKPAKATYAKPAFRPKPTKSATVAVPTTTATPTSAVQYDTTSTGTSGSGSGSGPSSAAGIGSETGSAAVSGPGTGIGVGSATGAGTGPSASVKPHGTMSDNDIESIESIILMLNETKTGPQYNSSASTTSAQSAATPHLTTLAYRPQENTKLPVVQVANTDYSPSTAYVTEKMPTSSYRPPSTSYVYSPQPTRRPIQVQSTISSSYGAVNVADNNGYYSVLPSGESITEHILAITKRPVLITAASFATSTRLPSTHYVPPEVTITASTSVTTRPPTVAVTSAPTTTTKNQSKRPATASYTTTRLPSTSYITGPTTPRPHKTATNTPQYAAPTTLFTPTRRPSPPATSKPTNKINPPRRNHTEPASTVYIFRPTLNALPTSTSSNVDQAQPQQHHVLHEHVIQSKPIMQFAAQTGQPTTTTTKTVPTTTETASTTRVTTTTEPPNPTVHITPKPTTNQVTSHTWTLQSAAATSLQSLNDYSTPLIPLPSTSYVYSPIATDRPATVSQYDQSVGDYSSGYGSTYAYPSTGPPPIANVRPQQTVSNDFEDPGYYGATSSPLRPSHLITTATLVETTTAARDETVTAQFDTNNFPPVRNPNLNITSGGINAGNSGAASGSNGPASAGSSDEFDISTPDFVEDEALNEKMGLLVSKIVESLQGNFEQLADVVYDDVIVRDPPAKPLSVATTRKPATAATAASVTKRPTSVVTRLTTRKPSSTAAAVTAAVTKPAASSARPTARPSVSSSTATVTKRPTVGKVTTLATKKPTATTTNAKRTTKRPTSTTAVTTRKPIVTKVPSTRRPTTKPTRKVIATTTVQQTLPPQQDEVVGEDDDDDDDDDEEEEDDEEIAANANEEPAEQSTPYAEGRIQCGIRPQVKSGRIVGGKGATFGEFPWQVLVRESTWLGLFTKNKCGGVLISKNYVVTAAHCQPGFLASLVTVFGEFDISGELEAKRSVTKNVKRVLVHREYDAATFENDLALLELESPIHYDTHIVPICMPSDAADFTGRMATVTGWGRLKYGGGVPSVLQEVQVPIIENSVCQEMFHTAGHNKKILSSFLCAGYANGQKDSCEGDSGGPLVLQRQDGRWELAGTVSHGIKCAAPYLPGVYMRTTYYKPWMQSIAGVH